MSKSLLEAITTNDLKSLKDHLMSQAKYEITQQLKEYYILDSHSLSDTVNEVFTDLKEELKKEIKEEYGEGIKEVILKKLMS